MAELALIIGFTATLGLALMEHCAAESEEEFSEAPLWMDYVKGPYVRTKRTVLKGRDW